MTLMPSGGMVAPIPATISLAPGSALGASNPASGQVDGATSNGVRREKNELLLRCVDGNLLSNANFIDLSSH